MDGKGNYKGAKDGHFVGGWVDSGNRNKIIENRILKQPDKTMSNGKRFDIESQSSRISHAALISNSPTPSSSTYHAKDDEICPGFWTPRMKCMICTGTIFFCVVAILVAMADSGHKIMEGTVGIYFKGGALQDHVNHPGIHFTTPFITDIQRIKIRPRTDTMAPIRTVTKDGIQNTFNNVQVISEVNSAKVVGLVKKYGLEFHKTLVFDRISEKIISFCAKHTIDEVYNTKFMEIVKTVEEETKKTITKLGNGGISIHHLTIPKPDIPPDIAKNYKEVKVQWTEQLVAQQQQKTEKIRKDTEELKAVADAQRSKKVQNITMEKQILEKEGQQKLSALENEILKARKENNANIENYAKKQLASANAHLFNNTGYVKLELAKAMSTNTKFFFSGDQSPLGAVFAKLMN